MFAKRLATIENTINLRIPDLTGKYQNLLNANVDNESKISNQPGTGNRDKFNLIIFDLSKEGLLSNDDQLGEKNLPKEVKHLVLRMVIPNLLLKRKNTTFENLLSHSLNSDDTFFLNNLENYQGSHFAFFDNYSTLDNCLVTTFQIMEKFYAFLNKNNFCLGDGKLLIIEPTKKNENCANNKFTQTNKNLAKSETKFMKKPKRSSKLTLDLSSDKNKITSKADVFIESLKGDRVKYDYDSINGYFRLTSLDQIHSLNNNEKLVEKFPNWLWSIIKNFDQFTSISNILDKFNTLEILEQRRLRQCFFNNNKNIAISNEISNTGFNSDNDFNTKPLMKISEDNNFTSSNKYNKNIYSLSNLQKQFHSIKKVNKKIQNLQINIPSNSLNDDLNSDHKNNDKHFNPLVKDTKNNSNNSASTASSSSSSSFDILYTPSFEYNIGKAIQSFNKNRYSNILPYEHSRVKIMYDNENIPNEEKSPSDHSDVTTDDGGSDYDERDSTSVEMNSINRPSNNTVSKYENPGKSESSSVDDYVNANYLTFPQINSNFHYIATQAPLPTTINDFWKTVWNEKVKIIVSLNSIDELKLKKWDIYWDDNNIKQTKDFKIKVQNSWERLLTKGLTLRIFEIERIQDDHCTSSNKRIVYQLQYVDWLDSCGIHIQDFLSIYKIKCQLLYKPKEFLQILENEEKSQLINFKDLALSFPEDPDKVPILVHCSAGCGRTGVFVTIDYLIGIFQNEKMNDNRIDIWNIEDDLIFILVNELRKQRISMVQTLTQYISCYDIMIEYFALINK